MRMEDKNNATAFFMNTLQFDTSSRAEIEPVVFVRDRIYKEKDYFMLLSHRQKIWYCLCALV